MKELSADDFFSQGEKALNELLSVQDNIILTKKGKPIARVEPIKTISGENVPGKLKNTVIFEKDIVSPLGAEIWESAQ